MVMTSERGEGTDFYWYDGMGTGDIRLGRSSRADVGR